MKTARDRECATSGSSLNFAVGAVVAAGHFDDDVEGGEAEVVREVGTGAELRVDVAAQMLHQLAREGMSRVSADKIVL